MTFLKTRVRLISFSLLACSLLSGCGGGGASSVVPSVNSSSIASANPSPTPGSYSPTDGTYYVSTTGSDNNPGTQGAPFATIQKAASVATAGQTVLVENGTYTTTASNMVVLSNSGTAGKPITFEAQTALGVTLDGRSFSTLTAFTFNSNAEGYVNIEGFNIQNFLNAGISMNTGSNGIADGNHDIVISNNHIHNIGNIVSCSGDGIVGIGAAQGTRNVTVENNEIDEIGRKNTASNCAPHGTSDHGLYIGGGNWTIENNNFHDNDAGWDIQMDGHSGDLDSGFLIENNTFGTHVNVGGNLGNIVNWANTGTTMSGSLIGNTFASTLGPPMYCDPLVAVGNPSWVISGNTIGNGGPITDCIGISITL